LLLKNFFLIFIFFNVFINAHADIKQSIIDRLIKVNNFSFSFEQVSKEKIENGHCLLVFDNKLKCKYNDKQQKEIIINNKTLVVLKKKYDKIYFYPISKSLFLNFLNKNNLIALIKR